MATTTPHTLPAAIGPTHPVYDTYRDIWTQLAHVAEGSGGFLTGTYIVAHPREWEDFTADTPTKPTKKLKERRTLARYHHLGGFILKQKIDGLFRQPPVRRMVTPDGKVIEDHPYLQWTENVDGAGQPIDQWLRESYRPALIFGHVFALLDRASDDGQTAADKAPLVLRLYTPLDVPDWLQNQRKELTAIKVVEALERTTLSDAAAVYEQAYAVREITADTAKAYTTGTAAGRQEQDEKAHGFGVLPVVVLYAERRPLTPVIGQSALGDPMLYIDLYNLTSEKRELERKQTFSLVNIPLGARADGGTAVSVEEAQAMMGQTTGTANVIFSVEPAKILSAETDNVRVYAEDEDKLVREICRLCAITYDQDGRDAESAESRRLKRADFNTCLAGYADELQKAELSIARLWYRGFYGAARWAQEWAKARPEVNYPQSFDETPFSETLEQATAAQALPLSESVTFRTEHNTRLIPKFLPDAPPDVVEQIRGELEALPTPEEERAQRLDEMAARFKGPGGAGTPTQKPPTPAAA